MLTERELLARVAIALRYLGPVSVTGDLPERIAYVAQLIEDARAYGVEIVLRETPANDTTVNS